MSIKTVFFANIARCVTLERGKYSQNNIRCDFIYIPGSSFGRKKVPDLNPAKFSAGFRKKRRRPEKTSGSKILKNRDDKRLDHTKQTAFAPRVVFSGTHSFHNPALEPSRSHCPRPSSEWPKSRTITKYKQTCAQAKTSKKKPRSMWQGTPISLHPCL